MKVEPVTLSLRAVRLEPLTQMHVEDLRRVGCDPEVWRFFSSGVISKPDELQAWANKAIADTKQGIAVVFAIIDLRSGLAVGSTRYFEISAQHRHLEIGHTWLGQPAWRTAINTECKYLLLRHAFETLGCLRVQLKTDSRNVRSQAAIEHIGGKKEGILRSHLLLPDGYIRDSVIYSVISKEWPDVKARLEAIIAARNI
ncbi:MAG TPA: GNAT family protein [Opitutaceae bacterium]|nr:GNAT family protein [Opitutaceae bacterium]